MRRMLVTLPTVPMVSAVVSGCAGSLEAANEVEGSYSLAPGKHGVTLKAPEGRAVFCYMTGKPKKTNLAANSVCCFHPLNTPSGERLTLLAPGDHPHHRGVFLAWHTMAFREKARGRCGICYACMKELEYDAVAEIVRYACCLGSDPYGPWLDPHGSAAEEKAIQTWEICALPCDVHPASA